MISPFMYVMFTASFAVGFLVALDGNLIAEISGAGDFGGLGFDDPFLLIGVDWTLSNVTVPFWAMILIL